MGGSYRSPGNTAPTTEWNVNVDPEAAGIVFAAFGADSTRPLALGLDVDRASQATPGSPGRDCSSSRLLARRPGVRMAAPTRSFAISTTRCASTWSSTVGTTVSSAPFIHDPLALATAIDPTLVRTEPVTVDVELSGRLTTGETVADWAPRMGSPAERGRGVAADADRFFERFIERVGDLAAGR